MPITRPRRSGGAAALIQYSERTKSAPSVAEKTKRRGNHRAMPGRIGNSARLIAPMTSARPSSGATPIRAASRGTNGTVQMLAMPATAVLRPISVLDAPRRSISIDRSGIDRLNPMPTTVTQVTAAAIAATSSDLIPRRASRARSSGRLTRPPARGGRSVRSGRESSGTARNQRRSAPPGRPGWRGLCTAGRACARRRAGPRRVP